MLSPPSPRPSIQQERRGQTPNARTRINREALAHLYYTTPLLGGPKVSEKGILAIFTIPCRLKKIKKKKLAALFACSEKGTHLRLELKATAHMAQETWVRFTVATNPARAR